MYLKFVLNSILYITLYPFIKKKTRNFTEVYIFKNRFDLLNLSKHLWDFCTVVSISINDGTWVA